MTTKESDFTKDLLAFAESALYQVEVPSSDSSLSLTDGDLRNFVEAYILLNAIRSKIESKLEAMKPILHKYASAFGSKDESGSFNWEVGKNTVKREYRCPSTPPDEGLRALLKTRGIAVESCYDIKSEVVLNASKLKTMVDLGKLEAADVEALIETQVSFAIKAPPEPSLKNVIQKAFDRRGSRGRRQK